MDTPNLQTLATVADAGWLMSGHWMSDSFTLQAGCGSVADGTPIGRITASGKCVPVGYTTVSATEAIGQTVISVTDASKITVGVTVKLMQAANAAATDSFAVTDTDLVNNTITLAYAITSAYAAGDLVRVVNGSETAVGILIGQTETGTSDDDEDYTDKAVAAVIHAVSADESALTLVDAQVKADLPLVNFV